MIGRHPNGYCLIGDVLRVEVHLAGPERIAIIEWVEAHGIDHKVIPLESAIVADAAQCRISYTAFVLNEEGRPIPDMRGGVFRGSKRERRVHQGETPPMQWPEILQPCPLLPVAHSKDS